MKGLRKVSKGSKLPPLVKLVSDSHIDLSYKRLLLLSDSLDRRFINYAEGSNIHTDDDAAKAAGYSARVVPGIQNYAFISEMLSLFFGMGWIIGGKMDLKFIRPFLVGEKITCEAEVTKIIKLEKTKERYAGLEVRCKNTAGDIISIGSARARLFAEKKN